MKKNKKGKNILRFVSTQFPLLPMDRNKESLEAIKDMTTNVEILGRWVQFFILVPYQEFDKITNGNEKKITKKTQKLIEDIKENKYKVEIEQKK